MGGDPIMTARVSAYYSTSSLLSRNYLGVVAQSGNVGIANEACRRSGERCRGSRNGGHVSDNELIFFSLGDRGVRPETFGDSG